MRQPKMMRRLLRRAQMQHAKRWHMPRTSGRVREMVERVFLRAIADRLLARDRHAAASKRARVRRERAARRRVARRR